MTGGTVSELHRHRAFGLAEGPDHAGAARLPRLASCRPTDPRPGARPEFHLRHRGRQLSSRDLERKFPRLGVDEDFLYATGAMPRKPCGCCIRGVIREPERRPCADRACGRRRSPSCASAGNVIRWRSRRSSARTRAINRLGRLLQATTRALQRLHHYGLLRWRGVRTASASTRPRHRRMPSRSCRRARPPARAARSQEFSARAGRQAPPRRCRH